MKENYRSVVTIHFGSISVRGVLASLRHNTTRSTSTSPTFFLPVYHWKGSRMVSAQEECSEVIDGNPQLRYGWASGDRGVYVGHTYEAEKGLRPVFRLQSMLGYVVLEDDRIVVHDECPRCTNQLW